MFDVHAHLTDKAFQIDLEEVLVRAEQGGVTGVCVVSEDEDDAVKVLQLCGRWKDSTDSRQGLRLHPCIGIHPERADISKVQAMLDMMDANKDVLVGVGEVGLDYTKHHLEAASAHAQRRARELREGEERQREQQEEEGVEGDEEERRDIPTGGSVSESQAQAAAVESVKEEQRQVFSLQVRKAMELNLAVNVHSRSAGHHALKLCQALGVQRALFHAFDGKASYAVAAVETHPGYAFSIPPNITRSPGFTKLVQRLPLENLALETDSPALPPVKGERNEPCNVGTSAMAIADIRGVTVEEVVAVTSRTARALFPKAFSESVD